LSLDGPSSPPACAPMPADGTPPAGTRGVESPGRRPRLRQQPLQADQGSERHAPPDAGPPCRAATTGVEDKRCREEWEGGGVGRTRQGGPQTGGGCPENRLSTGRTRQGGRAGVGVNAQPGCPPRAPRGQTNTPQPSAKQDDAQPPTQTKTCDLDNEDQIPTALLGFPFLNVAAVRSVVAPSRVN